MSETPSDVSRLPREQRIALERRLLEQRSARRGARAIPARPEGAPIPLSFAQQRLWFLQQLEPESPAYRLSFALRMTGTLRQDVLRAALSGVVERHAALRTVFRLAPGGPLQYVQPASPLPLESVDLRDCPDAEREPRALALASAIGARPFDLEAGPLLRAALLCLHDSEHLLVISIHHIACDIWSLGLFVRELGALYRAGVSGTVPAAPEGRLQYADFAAWQRARLQGETLSRQLSYWKSQLGGAVPHLDLPTDFPRPAVQSFRGGRVPVVLPASLVAGIKKLARRVEGTLFTVLSAALNVLLCRHTGQTDILLGFAIAGRDRAELEPLIGLFVNTLVLRTDLSGDPTFEELLVRVRETALNAYSHQDAPFEMVVQELHPERDLSRNPLFQVLVGVQNVPIEQLSLPDLELRLVELERADAHVDLTLFVTETPDGAAAGALEYNADLFERATVESMVRQLLALLDAAVKQPHRRLSMLALVDAAERAALIAASAPQRDTDHQPWAIHRRFEDRVAADPQATAVVDGADRLSYATIDARASQLARLLRRHGVGPDQRVAIFLERSAGMVVAMLAVLKAGAAYVPLETAYPSSRLKFMLDDAQPVVTITQASLRDRLPEGPGARWSIDADWGDAAGESSGSLSGIVAPESLAYVIYTSGSTGTPKGVMITHDNVCRLLDASEAWFHFGQRDVWSVFHSFAFDFSVWELWGPLLTGGRAVIVPYVVSRSPDAFLDLLRTEGVTVLNQTPSAFRQLCQADAAAGTPALDLRYVIFGGEALDFQSLASWFERRGDDQPRLINMYGITETTVHVTYRAVTSADVSVARGSLIGEPIPDLQLWILDRAGEPVPQGVPGEICVGGEGVARGYLGRPDLTADRFRPDPYADRPGARLYRSGDLARRRGNGEVQYLGRMDDQVKIRGFRIELGEIRQVLLQHPAVLDVEVVARTFGAGDTRLVAYLTPHPDRAAPVRALMKLEKEGRLPAHSHYDLPNGMTVVHLNRNETDFLYEEVFEHQTYLRHGVTIEDGACVFDVGANIGLFTLFAARQASGVRVFAFEPIPTVFERLEANVQVHGVQAELRQAGVARSAGQATFHYYPHVSIFSGRFADAAHESDVVSRFVRNQTGQAAAASGGALLDELIADRLETLAIECPLVALSEVIEAEAVECIDLLKIDVEKSEWEVLSGLREEHWDRIRQAIIEVHDESDRLARVVGLLQRHGFTVAVEQDALLEGTDLYSVYATRIPAAGRAGARPASPPPQARWSSVSQIVAELRTLARRQLPEYMVPAAFVMLESLPLTANGKLDRRALPDASAPQPDGATGAREPQSPAERILSAIWSAVLKVPRIGLEDNFFELGGDSILSIQVIAAARAEGLRLTPRQMFEHPTIADLARLAVPAVAPVLDSPSVGDVPLGPIQRWFFDQRLDAPGHFNQSVLLHSAAPLDQASLARAVDALVAEHDALRLRFEGLGGDVRQVLAPTGAGSAVVDCVDLSSVAPADARDAIEREALIRQASLDLERGPLMRATIFDGGPQRPAYLLIVIHHLVVDGVSWRILLRDLYEQYRSQREGTPAPARVRTLSFKRWCERLAEYAGGPGRDEEARLWEARLPDRSAGLPVDFEEGDNTVAAADCVVVALSAAETAQLIQEVPKAYGTQINDVLLAALSQCILAWTGAAPVVVHVEGHGRESLFDDDADLSRTVGWFTTLVPVALDIDAATPAGEALKRMKEQRRSLPHHGIGFGVLRHLSPDAAIRQRLSALPQAELSFNYQGQFDADPDAPWVPAPELSAGPNRAGGGRRAHLLDVDASVTAGCLRVAWTFSTTLHRRATIERVAESFRAALQALVTHCVGAGIRSFTPSDFPAARLSQDQLDTLLSRLR